MAKQLLLLITISLSLSCWAKESLSVSRCDLEPETGGYCGFDIERYFYNSTNNQCETFIYTGCDGNGNRFDTKDECERSCKHPPVDDTDDVEDEEDEEDDNENKGKADRPSQPNLFGKLFQKSLLSSFDLLKPDPFLDVFDPDYTKKIVGDDMDDKFDDNVEEEEKVVDNRDPFEDIFNLFRPRVKSNFGNFGLFSKRLTASPFSSLWSKSMGSLREKVDTSFEKLRSVFTESNETSDDTLCAVCKNVVRIIQFEIKEIKLSLEAVLKLVETICGFFPLAEKQCNSTIQFVREIIKDIDQGLSPEDICKNINMCKNETLPVGMTRSVSISFSKHCSPLCNLMKASHYDKANKMFQSWNATKLKLKQFCDDNKIIKKCDIFFQMLEKSEKYLSSMTEKQTNENCQCFKRQPLFETRQFDSCLRCNQFKQGMINEAANVNQSVLALAFRVKELCDLFPSEECSEVVSEFRGSLSHNTVHMPSICKVTNYCENTNKSNSFAERFKGSLNVLKGIFPDPQPMMMRGLGLDFKRFTPDCLFCKDCMGDLKETFKKLNQTVSGLDPAVKEGFSMYCQTKTTDGNYTTVCKKISDGIETVHKIITRRGDEEGMCKTLGVC